MSGHECELLCEAQSAIEYVNARGMPPGKVWKTDRLKAFHGHSHACYISYITKWNAIAIVIVHV